MSKKILLYIFFSFLILKVISQTQVVPVVPHLEELNAPFSNNDLKVFKKPYKVYCPETWFHYIGGNVAKSGITADMEAIAGAGFSGIQLFHGQFGDPWPGVTPQIPCLSDSWDEATSYSQRMSSSGIAFLHAKLSGMGYVRRPLDKTFQRNA